MINLNLVTKIVNSKQMKNLILTGLVFVTAISLSFGQLKVVAPDGNVNLGDVSAITTAEQQKLNVGGNINVIGNVARVGYKSTKGQVSLKIGQSRTTNGLAFIDTHPTGGDWVGRLLSNDSGVTTFSHKGIGQFQLRTFDAAAPIYFVTAGAPDAMAIQPNGSVGIGVQAPAYKLHVNGAAAKPGGGMWTNASDKRLKDDIQEYQMGLEDVLKLNPVSFTYNGKGGIKDTETRHVGLIAQEYQKVAPDAVSTFAHTEIFMQEDDKAFKTGKTEEFLAIDASQITFMLVNAVKEQQKVISELQEEVRNLKSTGVTSTATSTSVLIDGNNSGKALLAQNTPNPFTSNTKIDYFIPETAKTALMSFTDITGKEIKRLAISNTGSGSLDVSIKEMPIGIYSYSLVVDGSTIATKKMVLSR